MSDLSEAALMSLESLHLLPATRSDIQTYFVDQEPQCYSEFAIQVPASIQLKPMLGRGYASQYDAGPVTNFGHLQPASFGRAQAIGHEKKSDCCIGKFAF